MVTIDTLRITEDGKAIVLNAHVNDMPYFENVYIEEIGIDTQDTVQESFDSPSSNCIYLNNELAASIQTSTPIYKEPIVISGKDILDNIDNKSILISYTPLENATNNILDIRLRLRCTELDNSPINPSTNKKYSPIIILTNEMGETITNIEGKNLGNSIYEFNADSIELYNSTTIILTLYKITVIGSVLTKVDFSKDYNVDPIDINEDLNRNYFHLIYDIKSVLTGVNRKRVSLILTKNDFNENFNGDISDNLFFVYIKTNGTVAPNTPCSLDEQHTLGVTFDYGIIYNQIIRYTRELANSCEVPKNFINMILNLEALKASIETEHFIPAKKYFKYLGDNKNTINKSNCSCYGRNTV